MAQSSTLSESHSKMLRCEHCGGWFSLPQWAEHTNECLSLQVPEAGASFFGAAPASFELGEEIRDEVQALSAIFADDFSYSEAQRQLSILITVGGLRCKLLVRYTAGYPQSPPILAIQRVDHTVARECAAQLYRHLREGAHSLAQSSGGVFVHTLRESAVEFLEGYLRTKTGKGAPGQLSAEESLKPQDSPKNLGARAKAWRTREFEEDELVFNQLIEAELQRATSTPPQKPAEAVPAVPDTAPTDQGEGADAVEEDGDDDDDDDEEEEVEEDWSVDEEAEEPEVPSGGKSSGSGAASSCSPLSPTPAAKHPAPLQLQRQQAMLRHMLRLLCSKAHAHNQTGRAS
eukprot:RCo035105